MHCGPCITSAFTLIEIKVFKGSTGKTRRSFDISLAPKRSSAGYGRTDTPGVAEISACWVYEFPPLMIFSICYRTRCTLRTREPSVHSIQRTTGVHSLFHKMLRVWTDRASEDFFCPHTILYFRDTIFGTPGSPPSVPLSILRTSLANLASVPDLYYLSISPQQLPRYPYLTCLSEKLPKAPIPQAYMQGAYTTFGSQNPGLQIHDALCHNPR